MVSEEDLRKLDVAELRPQLVEAFESADYPVEDPRGLMPALPHGPGTTFESNGVTLTVLQVQDLGNEDLDVDAAPEFPYEDADSLVEDICRSVLEAQRTLREGGS